MELKGKSKAEIKKEFKTFYDKLFDAKGNIDKENAFMLIMNLIKLIPDIDKQDFAKTIIFDIALWCSNNKYDAIGIIDISRDDLYHSFRYYEEHDDDENDSEDDSEPDEQTSKVLELIDKYWKFDDQQQPNSSWHDKQDLLKEIEKQLNQNE